MSQWENRLASIFTKLKTSQYFTEEDLDRIVANPEGNWERFWTLVSMKRIRIDLVTRKYPIKTIDQL